MFISEITFPHLQAEREAQLTHELERRRVLAERFESDAQIMRPSRSSRRIARRAATPAQRRGDELTGNAWTSTLKA